MALLQVYLMDQGRLLCRVGTNNGDTVSISAVNLKGIVGYTNVDASTSTAAATALGSAKTSVDTVSEKRATFGAVMRTDLRSVGSTLSRLMQKVSPASRSRVLDARLCCRKRSTIDSMRKSCNRLVFLFCLKQMLIPQSALGLLR
ncbi:MAG: hypothetical protein Q9N32_01605 [Gammaproteobacteria bacterium]|nr:hypothetical protein [Gammaproteobacteria bacterium]